MPRFFRRAVTAAAALALGLTGVVVIAAPASAAGCTVTDGGDNAATDGTLRYAIETFNGGDDCPAISIQAGLTVTLSAPITLDVAVTITGGFGTTITRDGSFDMFEVAPNAVGQAFQFDNLTFDGVNSGVPGDETGRAFHTPGGVGVEPFASFTTNNSAFNNFHSDGIGGAIFLSGVGNGPVAFNVTSFGSNRAANGGGAAYVQDAESVSVSGNGLGAGAADGNYAGDSSDGSGGAFEFAVIGSGGVTIRDYRFTDNHALDGQGGAVYAHDVDGDVLFDTVQFGDDAAGNTAVSTDTTFSADGGGASIKNIAGDITVSNSTFRQNKAGGSGGGLWIEDTGDSEIEDVLIDTGTVFQQNEAGTDAAPAAPGIGGGAGVVGAQSLRVSEAEFGNALAPDPSTWGNEGEAGGGLWFGHVTGTTTIIQTGFDYNDATAGPGGGFGTSENGTIAVSAALFRGNYADGDGGAAFIEELADDATVVFDSSDFTDNTAENGGGAIFVDSIPESLALTTDQFTGNYAVAEGGGAVNVGLIEDGALADNQANFTVRASQFIENGTEGSDGGAIYVDENEEVLFIDSSTFSNNYLATQGEAQGTSLAVESSEGTTRILNSTFDEFEEIAEPHPLVFVGSQSVTGLLQIQSSTLNGNAITVFVAENGGASQLINSIFGAPSGEDAVRLVGDGNLLNLSYSLLSSAFDPAYFASAATNKFSIADMKLAPLAATPGTVPSYLLTRVPLAGSPALKAGDATASYLPAFDERGAAFPRVTAGGLDIGAVQTDLIPPLPATGGAVPLWMPIVGGAVLLVGIGAIVFTVLSRRRLSE